MSHNTLSNQKSALGFYLLFFISLLTPLTYGQDKSMDPPSTGKGVEIGNGKKIDGVAGVEIGNGSIIRVSGLYQLSTVFGKWRVDALNQFVRLTSASTNAIQTVDIDLIKADYITSADDLINNCAAPNCGRFSTIKSAPSVKKDVAESSLNGTKAFDILVFYRAGQLLKMSVKQTGVTASGSEDPFEQFMKMLESFEVITPTDDSQQ
jgi:hypothetical protein